MTALSKATLKATWVAKFQPTQNDFANLIDSWTDYYAGLEVLGASLQTSSNGVPVFTGTSTATFYSVGEIITPAYTSGSPAYTSAAIATVTSRAFFRRDSAGLLFESYGDSLGGSGNNITMSYYTVANQSVSGAAQKNAISFMYCRGSYFQRFSSSPNVAPAAFDTIGQVLFSATKTSGGLVTPAAINCYASTNGSAGGTPVVIGFNVRASGDASRNQGLQLSIAEGHVIFQPQSVTAASPVEGSVYYDSALKKLRCWNGTTWNDLF